LHINHNHISEYGAKLLDRQISLSEIKLDSFWPDGSISPCVSKDVKYRYKTLTVDIEFHGTPAQIEMNKGIALKDMSISTIKFDAIDHYYSGFVSGTNIKTKVPGFEVVTVTMLVIEHEDEIISHFNRSLSATIQLNSNATTPVILEITPAADLASAAITGLGEDISIYNLTTGQSIIIDGEKGTVTENGQNKYPDYDSWGFPKLVPGENIITVDNQNLDIAIKYKPRWI
jgi:phage-related protein